VARWDAELGLRASCDALAKGGGEGDDGDEWDGGGEAQKGAAAVARCKAAVEALTVAFVVDGSRDVTLVYKKKALPPGRRINTRTIHEIIHARCSYHAVFLSPRNFV
jgi:hypothetical protein